MNGWKVRFRTSSKVASNRYSNKVDPGSYHGNPLPYPFGSVASHTTDITLAAPTSINIEKKRTLLLQRKLVVPTSSRKVVNLPLNLFCWKNSWGYPTDHCLVSQGSLNWLWGRGFILCSEKQALHAKPLPALPLLRWNSPHSAGRWVAGLRAWAQSPHVAVTTPPTLKSPWRRNGELIGEPTHPRFDVCLQTFSWVNYHLNNKQESESFQVAISFGLNIHLCCLCLFTQLPFVRVGWCLVKQKSYFLPGAVFQVQADGNNFDQPNCASCFN